MANAATPTIGEPVVREETNVRAIGFPEEKTGAVSELSPRAALPVLARVPRLESEEKLQNGVGVATGSEQEISAPDEARHYRVDSTLALPAPLRPPIEQIPPQPVVPVLKKAPLGVAPSQRKTLRQFDLSSAEDRIAAFLLRLQVMLKPLARIILLAALLTASALAYLLLEDNLVPQVPAPPKVVPSSTRPEEPRLTSKPTTVGLTVAPTSKPSSGPVLSPHRPLTAIGPGRRNNTSGKQPPASHKAAPTVVIHSRKRSSKSLSSPETEPIAQSQNVPINYPNTGHPDVKLLPLAGASSKQAERPVAVAKLTGSIQQPIQR